MTTQITKLSGFEFTLKSALKRTTLAASMFVAALAGVSSAAQAKETYTLQYATYLNDAAPQARALKWWADEVEKRTEGAVKVEMFLSSSLLKPTEMLRGVADGRAQMAYIANPYFPGELPLSSVAGVPFVTSNTEAQMRTFYELYQRNDAYRSEWESNGIHILFFNPLSENIVGMSDPVIGIDDLQGQSIRSVGYITQVLNILGANPVAIPAPEIYESVLRGTIDGYSGFPYALIPAFKFQEVAPHILALDTGNFAFSGTGITKDLWDEMPEDIQTILTEVGVEHMDVVIEMLAEVEAGVCDQPNLRANGRRLGRLPPVSRRRRAGTCAGHTAGQVRHHQRRTVRPHCRDGLGRWRPGPTPLSHGARDSTIRPRRPRGI